MLVAAVPKDEEARLNALYSYDILDTVFEAALDDITEIARWITGAPIGLISLVDKTRQWFKSNLAPDACDMPRDWSFCARVIVDSQLTVVPDTRNDTRFADNPLVTGEPKIRFYAGVPLTTPDGFNLGALCVIDRRSRELSGGEHLALGALGRLASAALELRRVVLIIRRQGDDIMDGDASGRLASELLVKPLVHFWERMSVLPRDFSLQARPQLDASEPALALVLKELDEQTAFIGKLSQLFRGIVRNPGDAGLLDQQRDLMRRHFPLADWAASAERDYVETVRRAEDQGAAEAERLAELADQRLTDASASAGNDMVVRLAALLFGTRIAAISLLEDGQPRFSATVGFESGQEPLTDNFSAHIQGDLLVVLDARPDERFFAEPLVAAAPKIRFFAGARLYGAGGRTLGALYVMSPQNRRSFSKENQAKLKVLAWLVSRKLELRRVLLEEREQAERAAAVAVPGKQVTTSNVNAEFLELMAKVASGDLPDEEVMAISMKAWNERVRSSVLLGACLRSLRRTMSTKQYETFTAKMDGFSL